MHNGFSSNNKYAIIRPRNNATGNGWIKARYSNGAEYTANFGVNQVFGAYGRKTKPIQKYDTNWSLNSRGTAYNFYMKLQYGHGQYEVEINGRVVRTFYTDGTSPITISAVFPPGSYNIVWIRKINVGECEQEEKISQSTGYLPSNPQSRPPRFDF